MCYKRKSIRKKYLGYVTLQLDENNHCKVINTTLQQKYISVMKKVAINELAVNQIAKFDVDGSYTKRYGRVIT